LLAGRHRVAGLADGLCAVLCRHADAGDVPSGRGSADDEGLPRWEEYGCAPTGQPVPPRGRAGQPSRRRRDVADERGDFGGAGGANDRRYWDLVQRALAYLPLGPKTIHPHPKADELRTCTMSDVAAEVRRTWWMGRLDQDLMTAGAHGVRVIANTVTLQAWRNGPIEGVHAGRCEGYGLNERRVSPKAEKAIVRHAQGGIFAGIKAVDYLRYDDAWPPPAERVLPFLHGLVGPIGWSSTEQSRLVELPLRGDAPAI